MRRQINNLLLFGAAENLRRQRDTSLTPQVWQARRGRDPRPYKRQEFAKRKWLEEV